jgi:hypothetical protein
MRQQAFRSPAPLRPAWTRCAFWLLLKRLDARASDVAIADSGNASLDCMMTVGVKPPK